MDDVFVLWGGSWRCVGIGFAMPNSAFWGPQCEPESGDWYARHLYYPGHWQYDVHVKKYGNRRISGLRT